MPVYRSRADLRPARAYTLAHLRLLFRQDSSQGEYYASNDDAEYKNTDDPDANLYSVMGDLDNYYIEGDDGLNYLTFKWVWPNMQSSTNANFKNW